MKTIKYLLFISFVLLSTYLSFEISYHSIMAENYQAQAFSITSRLFGTLDLEEHNEKHNSVIKYCFHRSQVRNKSWLFISLLVVAIILCVCTPLFTQQTNLTKDYRVKLIQWLMYICILLLIPSLFAPFLIDDVSISINNEPYLLMLKSQSIGLTILQFSGTNKIFCLILLVCCIVLPAFKFIYVCIATTKYQNNEKKRKIFKKYPMLTMIWSVTDFFVITLLPTFIIIYGKNINLHNLDFGFYFYIAHCILAFFCIFLIEVNTRDDIWKCISATSSSVECKTDTRENLIEPELSRFSSANVLSYLKDIGFSFVKKINKTNNRNFNCTLFCPPKVNKDEVFFIQIFIYLQKNFNEAKKAAYNFDEKAISKGNISLNKIRKKEKLAFHLHIENIELVNPIKILQWNEITDSVIFEIHIPKNYSSKYLIGKVSIMNLANSIFLGHINFKLNVSHNDNSYQNNHNSLYNASAKWYQYIFVSYSRKDIKEVMKRVQMINLLKYKYFQDIYYLKPGNKWKHEILKNIESSDAFFLFWSSAAKNSTWVKKEIDYALTVKKGNDSNPPEIVPVILEQPVPSPPDELKHIHFNDCISLLTI